MKLLVNDKELAYYLISLIDLKELCKEIKIDDDGKNKQLSHKEKMKLSRNDRKVFRNISK